MFQWMKNALARRPGAARRAQEIYRLGEAEALRQNNERAAGLIRKAIALDDTQPQFHYALGCVLQASGAFREAAASYQRAIALDPSNAPAHINLGYVLQTEAERSLAAPGSGRALAA